MITWMFLHESEGFLDVDFPGGSVLEVVGAGFSTIWPGYTICCGSSLIMDRCLRLFSRGGGTRCWGVGIQALRLDTADHGISALANWLCWRSG